MRERERVVYVLGGHHWQNSRLVIVMDWRLAAACGW